MCKIFVALNFRGLDQRKFFNVLQVLCVKKCVSTYRTPLLQAVLLVRPTLLATGHHSVTTRFAMDIAGEGIASECDPLGSGSPSLCLKH